MHLEFISYFCAPYVLARTGIIAGTLPSAINSYLVSVADVSRVVAHYPEGAELRLHFDAGGAVYPRLRDSARWRSGELTQPRTNFFGQLCRSAFFLRPQVTPSAKCIEWPILG